MIRLVATNQTLQVVLGGTVATNQLDVSVFFSTHGTATYQGGYQSAATNNTTDVDICNAPAAGDTIDIDHVIIHNKDTAAATVTVKTDTGGTERILVKETLAVGYSLSYTHGEGWSTSSSASGVTDHGALTGLADDDHTQYVLRSTLTTKGDLFARTVSGVDRLAVGTNDYPLVADSGASTGLAYKQLPTAGLANSAVTDAKIAAGGTLTFATSQATTSGSTVDFTGIPSGTKEINVLINGVSTSGTAGIGVQLGDSGGIETTGYNSIFAGVTTTNVAFGGSSGTAFASPATNSAGVTFYGVITLKLFDGSSNLWFATGTVAALETPNFGFTISGAKVTSATLDRVRFLCGGSDTFDAGSVNISYK